MKNKQDYTVDNIYDKTALRVVGWTDYDSYYMGLPDADLTDEVYFVVAREVRDNKYLFGGETHENGCYCAPVLSNGTVGRFSWRGWGTVIGLAYDERDKNGKPLLGGSGMGYMDMFINPASRKTPDKEVKYEELMAGLGGPCLDFSLPESLYFYDNIRFWICGETEETAKVTGLSKVRLFDAHEDFDGCCGNYLVQHIFRADAVEEVMRALEEYPFQDEVSQEGGASGYERNLGLEGVKSKEEVAERLKKKYPDSKGFVCFLLWALEY